MGKDFRPFGYVLQSRIFSSGASAPLAKMLNCHIEPELCLIVGSRCVGMMWTQQPPKLLYARLRPHSR